jgi:DNA-binding SARP family transcriptional activator/TolB-like protein/Tfp pilus assembly protein PilF
MSKLSHVTLRLLGGFAIEANVGRPIPISVRSRKARALLAFLAMKPDYRARREELATLFWGDNPDALARHSLRQCLILLRQDLCLASDILLVDREAIGLRAQFLSVDARTFTSLARSTALDELTRAAELWRGPFLPDLALDIEEFDTWHRHEAERLATAAAGVFVALCRNADANGDGERAITAAERLVALEPTREDRQRTALMLFARHEGREAALSRARQFTDLLRSDLDVSPQAATRALIDAIKRGDFESAHAPDLGRLAVQSVAKPAGLPDTAPIALALSETKASPVSIPIVLPAEQAPRKTAPANPPFWRRWPLAAACAIIAFLAMGTIVALGVASAPKLWSPQTDLQRSQALVVLPFAVDNSGQPDDPAFARVLTHNLIGYLSRFDKLRVISEQTSDFYRDRRMDVAHLMTDLGAQYAIVGRVQGTDSALRIDFQLVDTATRTNLWSDHLQRERSDPTLVADEAARGIARALAVEIGRVGALRMHAKPSSELTLSDLVARGYLALRRGTIRENLTDAMTSFDEALRRDPHYQPALLAVARVHIIAAANFIDLDFSPDLGKAEQLVNEALAKSPNSISALYSLALLQKYRRQYHAAIRSLQRCLELNPSFLPAQGQIGNLLTRIGQPQKGLEQILQTIRVATPNDPTTGYWYLFAAEAELELGHDRAALDWALRANAFMPGSPLVQAWLASIYTTIGDKSNAAKYVAALTKMAPDRTRLFMNRSMEGPNNVIGRRGPRILDGLRLALGSSLG